MTLVRKQVEQGFVISFVLKFVVCVYGVSSMDHLNYEPLIMQRHFGQIVDFQRRIKPTMMPNPRGYFVVNDDNMYVDLWAKGRRVQLKVNRGSPAFHRDHVSIVSNDNNTLSNVDRSSQQFNFFSGYLNDDENKEVFGYISVTNSGEETLVLTVNFGHDTMHIETSEFVLEGQTWFNTIAYTKGDVANKMAGFRTRKLMSASKKDVIDYYSSVLQYNYSAWDSRPINPESRVCPLVLISDPGVYKRFAKREANVHNFHMYCVTMGYHAFRKHDFDMDGIADNMGYTLNTSIVIKEFNEQPWADLIPFLRNNNGKFFNWFRALEGLNRKKPAFKQCAISGFTNVDIRGSVGYTISTCCKPKAATIVTFKHLITPANVAGVFCHELAHLLGSINDIAPCRADLNKKITLGRYVTDRVNSFKVRNNLHVSPCNMLRMRSVAQKIYNSKSCLVPYTAHSKCGNRVREGNETCDCGDRFECPRVDKCCAPVGTYFKLTPCTIDNVTKHVRHEGDKVIKYTYQCSPKSHECCDDDCMLAKGKICRFSEECENAAYCDGVSPNCPRSTAKKTGSPCEDNTAICIEGSCVENICQFKHLELCICSHIDDSCYICCKIINGSSQECVPSQLLGTDFQLDDKIFHRKSGSLCGSRGVCISGKCEEYEEEPENSTDLVIVTTISVIEHKDIIMDLTDWYSDYWYLFLIVTVLLTFLIVVATHLYRMTYKKRKVKQFDEHVRRARQRLEGNAQLQKASPETRIKASRLLALFPTAPQRVVIQTALRPRTEEAMVLLMLRRGYPMRRLTG